MYDRVHATMGLPSEIVYEEKKGNDVSDRFPSRVPQVRDCLERRFLFARSRGPSDPRTDGPSLSEWATNSIWLPLQIALLADCTPERQILQKSSAVDASGPLLLSPSPQEWLKDQGPDNSVVVVRGNLRRDVHRAADSIAHAWHESNPGYERHDPGTSFTFALKDPSRDSIEDMIKSLVTQLSMTMGNALDTQWRILHTAFLAGESCPLKLLVQADRFEGSDGPLLSHYHSSTQ